MNNISWHLDHYIKIQNKFESISLGGSVALMIYGVIPHRKIKDLDIITTSYINKNEILYKSFGVEISSKPSTNNNHIKFSNINFDMFINPNATYNFINYKDWNLRLSPIEEIIFFKSKGLLRGIGKDVEDFKEIIKNNKITKNIIR